MGSKFFLWKVKKKLNKPKSLPDLESQFWTLLESTLKVKECVENGNKMKNNNI